MPAPTFILEAETAWTSLAGAPRTTGSFSVVAGDIIVACMMGDNVLNVGTLTASGGSLTWTVQQNLGSGSSDPKVVIATATVDTNKSMTVTVTRGQAAAAAVFGVNALVFRGVGALGATAGVVAGSGAPTLNLTTTAGNSAVVVANCDTSAADGSSRVWRTGAGTLTEQTYDRSIAAATFYAGYHADAGATGTYAVGLSAPAGQSYSMAALEVQGSGGGGGTTTPQQNIFRYGVALPRASSF